MKRPGPRPTLDDATLWRMYAVGMRDSEIAAAVGLSAAAVFLRRKKLGLASLGPRRGADDRAVAELNEQGLNDQDIADVLGCSRCSVAAARRRQGLPIRRKPHPHAHLFAIILRMSDEGMKDPAIARALHLTVHQVCEIRRKNGVKRKARRPPKLPRQPWVAARRL